MTDFASGVTIKVNGVPVVISAATQQVNHAIVHYTIPAVQYGDVVTWEYLKSAGVIGAEADCTVLEDVSPQVVTNNVTPPTPVISSPSFAQQNTSFTNDMGIDGYSWPSARPITIDKYNKLFAIAENSSTSHCFVYSNDGGASWSDSSLTQGFITRGTVAYDSVNDLVHVLWDAQSSSDGIIYRRYTIQRDGSNNITGFTRDTSVNLQLDLQVSATMDYKSPVILWLNDAAYGTYGAVFCAWIANNEDTFGSELRSSMRVLSNDLNDNIAINWAAPVTASTTTIGNAPTVPYTYLATTVAGITSINRKTAGSHALDIYCFYTDGNTNIIKFKRLRWNSGAHDWSTGLISAVTVSNITRSGTDSGYSSKSDLSTFPYEDTTHDLLYFGFANWKSNADGDTWSYVTIDGSDVVSSPVDVYSAGGAHSFAPTGDILYDNALSALAVSYIKTSTQTMYAQAFQNVTQIQAEILLFNSAPVDVPLLGGRLNNKLLCMFRDTNSPKLGWFGTADWA